MSNFEFFMYSASPFSNWFPSRFKIDGIEYGCNEQFYMYKKAEFFNDKAIMAKIMETNSPMEMKRLGKQVKGYNESDWNKVCKEIMSKGLHAKVNIITLVSLIYSTMLFFQFSQNVYLKMALLATAGKTLVEASPYDKKWGIGLLQWDHRAKSEKTWRGQNWLGYALTELREDLAKDV